MRKLIAFTGAGISQASGLPTYAERPELRVLFKDLHNFKWETYLRDVYTPIVKAMPNDAHYALAEYDIPIITQNIDRLHTRAGSKYVVELHGSYDVAFCEYCGNKCNIGLQELQQCSACGIKLSRPDIVFYGEDVRNYWKALDLVAEASTILVIGTSLEVYPANQLINHYAHNVGCNVVYINDEASKNVPEWLRRNLT